MVIEEFVINKHLSLRFEDGETNIYINEELFRQCKSLILNIPTNETEYFNDIESIEEAVEKLKSTEKTGWNDVEYGISPEEEFFAHCSNIQAWYESGYDSRILHYSLSFSILQELAKYDPHAKTALKEEIAKRLASGYESVVNYIYESQLVLLLSHAEIIDVLLHPKEAEILRELESVLQQPVYIKDEEKFAKHSYNGHNYLTNIENKRVRSLYLGGLDLDAIPDVICKFKYLTDLYFQDLSNFKYLPELLKHLFIWQDSDFSRRHFT
jgi:hypothetical protein